MPKRARRDMTLRPKSERKIDGHRCNDQAQHNGEHQFCLDAAGGMRLCVVYHSASPDEAKERNHDDCDPDRDQREAVIVTERSREAIELQSGPDLHPVGFSECSDEEVEFLEQTKPNAMIAIPVLTQARKVRSFAAWSEYLSIIETSLDVVDGFVARYSRRSGATGRTVCEARARPQN